MAPTIMPMSEHFVAEVGDIDLGQALPADALAVVREAFARYAVLVFPGQQLEPAEQLAFAQYFGPLESNLLTHNPDARFRVTPELVDISNLTPDARIWSADSRMRQFHFANQLWHTDSSFKYLPARASLLYARTVAPLGGHTEFADLRAAYDALPSARQASLEGLVAEHALAHSRALTGFNEFTAAERANLPPVPQMLVRRLPESGRDTLYLASHISRILGLPDADGRALVAELMAHATARQFVHTHRWRVGDLVMWDNRCTMHRGTPFDDQRYVRDMLRATVSDTANTCEQAGVLPAAAAKP